MPEIEYVRPTGMTIKELAKAASIILPKLFLNEYYSENEKCIYRYICHRNMEDFIDRELFTYAGVIIFDIPDSVREDEILYRFATIYFLHCRHNAKLQRGIPEKFNMKVIDDWLYELIRVAARKCCNDWEKKKESIPKQEKFFELFQRLSFVFEDSNVRYIWNGDNYCEKQDIQIKLSVTLFEDEIKTYDELILSLLTKKRNGIADYKNSAIFWRHVMQIRRGKDTYKLEANISPNKDILMLVLALAMDITVYDLLKSKKSELTKKHCPVRTFRYPYIGEDEEQILIERLQFAGENLRTAIKHTNDADDIYAVPRRMLFDANLYLLQKGKRPIIPLKGEEVTEVERHISKKILKEYYNEDTILEGKNETQIKVLRLNLPIL